jgi:ADP-heptose:LPS heptosyltransferase
MNRKINEQLRFHKLRPPIIRFLNNKGEELKEYPKPSGRKVLVIRYGAIGDMVFCSPLPRLLKEQGYYVVMNVQPRGVTVLRYNPYVDEFWYQERNVILNYNLDKYWEMLSEGFDRVINLSGSIEGSVLKHPEKPDYKEPRTEECDENYYDRTMRLAGFPEQKGLRGELYFTEEEENWAKEFLSKYKDNFKVLLVPAGSAFSKAWPWWPFVFNEMVLYRDIPELITISTGDDWGRLLDWEHPQHVKGTGKLSIRESMILTKYVDLVIGPDTGIIHAAGCYETPKICLLGQCSKNNLTKYWINDYSIQSPAKCSPCYNLIYSRDQCPRGKYTNNCICMEELKPELVIKEIKKIYKEWKREKFHRRKLIITPAQYKEEIKQCPQLQTL